MKIKKLDIAGFKSFAEPFVIDFHPGINILVGPNGCGKTNVVEAIRWALGERSAARLRGSRMESIIFGGTTRRRALGMAEVIISMVGVRTDDETTEEYTLGRRIYRNGESLYKLNKSNCRLKDVEEFLLDNGVGSGAYLVIEQAMIEQILSNRPQELRTILDEAAGIVRYKKRKEEALLKLQATSDNLARVRDVSAEVEGRLGLLKKQASRATRARNLADRINEMERKIVLTNGHVLLAHYHELQENLKKAKLLESRAAALLAEAEVRNTEARVSADRAAEAVSTRREALHLVEREMDSLGSREELLGERIERYLSIVEETTSSIEQAESLLLELEKEELKRTEEIDGFQLLLVEAQDKTGKAESELAVVEKELGSHRGDLDRVRAALLDVLRKTADLERQLSGMVATAEGAQSHLDRLVQEKEQLGKRVEELAGLLEDKAKQCVELTESATELKREMEVGETEQEVMAKDLRDAEKKVNSAHAALASVTARLDQIKHDLENLNSGKKSIEGSLPIPATWLEVPSHLETAVAAVLGDMLVAPILTSAEAIGKAVSSLSTDQYALLFQGDKEIALTTTEGPGELLIDLLSYPASYKPLLSVLLGNVRLVDEITPEILRNLSADVRLITTEGVQAGECWIRREPVGAKARGLVLQRQLRELDEEEVSVRLEYEIAEKNHTELKNRNLSSQENLDTIQQRYRETSKLLTNAEAELESLKEEQKRLAVRLSGMKAEEEKHKRILDESESDQNKIKSLHADLTVIRDQQTQDEQKLIGLIVIGEQNREDCWQQVLECRAASGEQESMVRELERQLRWTAERIAQTKQQKESSQDARNKAQHEEQTTRSELQEIRVKIRSVAENREKLSVELRTDEEILSQTRTATATSDEEVRKLRDEHQVVADEAGKLEASQIMAEAELAILREKARELKIGVSIEEAVDSLEGEISDVTRLSEEVTKMRNTLDNMGEINFMAEEEFRKEDERFTFLASQIKDLEDAETNLMSTVSTLDRNSRETFLATLERININFQNVFSRLFDGGEAALVLPEGQDPVAGDLEIIARPPGKRTRQLTLLSGGEKALTAVALLFALFLERPSPFCILDEVDAPLDDANVQRFLDLLREFSRETQFFVITHNKRTMEASDNLVGVTMEEEGVSSIVSLRLSDVDELIAKDK